jgi:hypothetical protein
MQKTRLLLLLFVLLALLLLMNRNRQENFAGGFGAAGIPVSATTCIPRDFLSRTRQVRQTVFGLRTPILFNADQQINVMIDTINRLHASLENLRPNPTEASTSSVSVANIKQLDSYMVQTYLDLTNLWEYLNNCEALRTEDTAQLIGDYSTLHIALKSDIEQLLYLLEPSTGMSI